MLAGTENTLSALIQSELASNIQAATGQAPQSPNVIIELSDAIAFAVIPHFIDNADVGPGTFAAGGDSVTGVGELL